MVCSKWNHGVLGIRGVHLVGDGRMSSPRQVRLSLPDLFHSFTLSTFMFDLVLSLSKIEWISHAPLGGPTSAEAKNAASIRCISFGLADLVPPL